MTSAPQNGIISGINITPLVDVSLVLLIIFIVTAKLVVTPAIPLDLPRASQSHEIQVVLSVAVPPTGPVLVNGSAVASDARLIQLAREAHARDRELRVVISADGAAYHRRVIHVLDLIKRAGISRVAFGAVPSEEGSD
jgi:biopolymer transport protein TolR